MSILAEIDEKIKELEKLKKSALKGDKNKDLATVQKLCKKHGFTEKILKNSLAQGRTRKK
jgi:hypothetical protein